MLPHDLRPHACSGLPWPLANEKQGGVTSLRVDAVACLPPASLLPLELFLNSGLSFGILAGARNSLSPTSEQYARQCKKFQLWSVETVV